MKITKQQWLEAQAAEKKQHYYSYEEGSRLYKHSYDNYFRYLETDYNHDGKIIVEIGCADFPALEHCTFAKGIVIEPMQSDTLEAICKRKNIEIIQSPVEEINIPECDEIWLLNVMQHIIDPDLFVQKCKEAAKVIRFFEPVDFPTCVYHPHTYTLDNFVTWFSSAKRYTDKIPHFHQADCAYGVWRKDK